MHDRSFGFCLIFGLLLVSSARLLCTPNASAEDDPHALPHGDIHVWGPGMRPQLFFACELDTDSLESFFSDPTVTENLKELSAGVALAISDLSPGRAQVVHRLSQAGIPMIAWIVLPKDQGYYLNAGNAAEAGARFTDFEKWTADYGLRWDAVGLDIEPNFSDFAEMREHKLRFAATLLRRSFDTRRVASAREAYSALIRRIQSDGYAVETYQFVFIADERRVHSTLLERLFGIVDVRPVSGASETPPKAATASHGELANSSRELSGEVLMIYTSFNHKAGAALIWKYGPEAQAIAVGSTAPSGDPSVDAKFPPLSWDEFSHNLIVASHFSRIVGVYNLEGCVRQGFLPRLSTLDWSQFVTISASSLRRAQHVRHVVETVIWTASHLPYLTLLAILAILAIGALIWHRRSRKKVAQRLAGGFGT
jgi:hypothetical protein